MPSGTSDLRFWVFVWGPCAGLGQALSKPTLRYPTLSITYSNFSSVSLILAPSPPPFFLPISSAILLFTRKRVGAEALNKGVGQRGLCRPWTSLGQGIPPGTPRNPPRNPPEPPKEPPRKGGGVCYPDSPSLNVAFREVGFTLLFFFPDSPSLNVALRDVGFTFLGFCLGTLCRPWTSLEQTNS